MLDMDKDYTKREIEHFFREITEALKRQDGFLLEIRSEVKKTNDRVSVLEFWRESFMAKIAASVAAISVGWVLFKEFILNK